MADAATGAPDAPTMLPPSPEVDFSNSPVFSRQGYDGPARAPTMWDNLTRPSPFSQGVMEADPLSSIGPAVGAPLARAATGIVTQDLPIVGRALGSPEGRQEAALSDYPDLQTPRADEPGNGFWNLFKEHAEVGALAADSGARESALADSVTQHIADIKEATGADIPNPAYGGFNSEAVGQVLARIKAGENIPYGVPFADAVQKAAYQLFQNSLQDLASKHQSGSPDDTRMLAAINPALSAEGYADAFTKDAQTKAEADYAKSSGYLLPWLASTAGEMGGYFRNPINAAALLVGPGELVAEGAAARIAEMAGRQAAINVGAEGAQEPGLQERRAQLGEDNGLVPALKDLGTSALFGAVPGAVMQGIHEIFARFGSEAGPGVTEEFLRRKQVDDFIQQARAAPGGPEAEAARAASAGAWVRKQIDDFLAEKEARERAALAGGPSEEEPRALGGGPTEPPPGAPPSPPPEPPTGDGGSGGAVLAATERNAAARGERAPNVSPDILDLPRTTNVTGAAIESADMDHAVAPPKIDGVSPQEHLAAYEGTLQHQENPDQVAPPILPNPVPEAGPVGVPPDRGAPLPPIGGSVIATKGYEGPNPDAIQNRIAHLEHEAENPDTHPKDAREFRRRARDFRGYVERRDAEFDSKGTPEPLRTAVRALRPDDIVVGTTTDGRQTRAHVTGFGEDGHIGVTDSNGLQLSIRPSEITAVDRGVRADVVPSPAEGETHTLDGKPILYTRFDPRTLGTDAEAFQYKGNSDQAGVTNRLAGVQEWNPLAAGNVVVYERADGRRFVVDGHQRLGLAKRLFGEGHPPIGLGGALLKERDGWTPADARAIAAKKNIQEGSGETLDTARVLRDRPDMWDRSLPASSPKLKQAKGLADLSDDAWGMMVNGVVPENYASLVGQGVADRTMQASVIGDIAKIKPKNENEVRMIIADANALGAVREMQTDIFGTYEATRTYVAERARVYGAVVKMLSDDKRVFSMLDREAERIEAAGNVLTDANADQATRAAQLAQILSSLASRTGPVSAALNRAAETVANGTHAIPAARAFLRDIDRLIKEEGLQLKTAPAIARPEPSPHDLDTPAGRQMQAREMEADAIARPAPVEHNPPMEVAGKEMPAETIAVVAPDSAAVASAERGAGPSDSPEAPRPYLTPEQILARPEVRQAIETPRSIDRRYRVPYLAGSSNAGGTTYIDASIPPTARLGGRNVDVAKYLNIHEQVEHALMIEGLMPYEQAHRIATEHEIAAVRADGVNVTRYNDFMDGHLKATEAEIGKGENFPPDLYTKPYPHKEAEFIAREESAASAMRFGPASTTREQVAQARGAWKAAEKEHGKGSRQEVDARTEYHDRSDEFAGVVSAWNDIGAGYAIRKGIGQDNSDRQFIKTPSGNVLIRGTDTEGRPYQEFEVTTSNPFAKGAMGWVKEAEDYLRARMSEKPESTFATLPAHPVEVAAREMADNAKRALEASGTPLDKFVHDAITQHVEPAIDRAFPKQPVATEAGPEGTQQTLAPGIAPVTDADRLRAAAGKPMTGGSAPPPAGGLFDETARAQPDLLDMSMADRWAAERQKILDTVPHEAVLSKLIGECQL